MKLNILPGQLLAPVVAHPDEREYSARPAAALGRRAASARNDALRAFAAYAAAFASTGFLFVMALSGGIHLG